MVNPTRGLEGSEAHIYIIEYFHNILVAAFDSRICGLFFTKQLGQVEMAIGLDIALQNFIEFAAPLLLGRQWNEEYTRWDDWRVLL